MKKIRLISFQVFVLMMITISCQDDDHELGPILSPSQIDIDVIQDMQADAGGNTVILKNNTPGIIPVWDYGTGRSTRQTDTVRYAFKGTYEIRVSAVTAGGIVALDPVTVEVTEDNLRMRTRTRSSSRALSISQAWTTPTDQFPMTVTAFSGARYARRRTARIAGPMSRITRAIPGLRLRRTMGT